MPANMQCCESSATPRCCRDCERTYCQSCFGAQHGVIQMGRIANGGWDQLICPLHGRLLEYRCGQDGDLTCCHCLIIGSHVGHAPCPTPFWFSLWDFRWERFTLLREGVTVLLKPFFGVAGSKCRHFSDPTIDLYKKLLISPNV